MMRVTEVQLHFLGPYGKQALRLDPGKVNVLLLDDHAFALYAKGLAPRDRQIQVAVTTATDVVNEYASALDLAPSESVAQMTPCNVRLRAGGRWLLLVDIVQCSEVVIFFQAPSGRKKTLYEMTLPLAGVNGPPLRAVFWNATARDAYRNGMSASGDRVNPLRYANPDGEYLKGEERDGQFSHVPFRPHVTDRAGKYHSSSGAVCYHFENCQWSCVDQ